LDIGCGLGGKTVAYGEAGAAEVFGADLAVDHAVASQEFAKRKFTGALGVPAKRKFTGAPGLSTEKSGLTEPTDPAERKLVGGPGEHQVGWGFSVADAAVLPFADGAFDTVVANDAMEHFAKPESAVREMARVTKKGGAIWLFFTPHYSPLGSHLYDYVYTPWCHLVFRRSDLEGAIRKVLQSREPDSDPAEIDERIEQIMTSYDNDLNHMSVRWFFRIIRNHPELKVAYEEFRPAKFSILKPLTRVPFIRELVTGTVVCRLERIGE
jgi:ubiquinone/menaquinone biosynthesis C-methylase UbiE